MVQSQSPGLLAAVLKRYLGIKLQTSEFCHTQVETRTKIMVELAGASTPSLAAHLWPPCVPMRFRSLAALGYGLCSKKSPCC